MLNTRCRIRMGYRLSHRQRCHRAPRENENKTGKTLQISNMGFLPMTCDQYLSLLDIVGRMIRSGKRGVIPADLPPILQRLKLNPQNWLDSFLL